MEMVVLIQTHREPESITKDGDFSLDDLPLGLKLARPRKLEEEARRIFEDLVKYHGSAHISSANLMTTMGSLTNIARLRPTFMSRVITALEMLQANLPPTLAKSQVSSVRNSAVKRSIGSTTGCIITEKDPTRAFSWLKAATTAFTFKTLLRHIAKQALTPQSLNVKLGPRRKSQKGQAVWLA